MNRRRLLVMIALLGAFLRVAPELRNLDTVDRIFVSDDAYYTLAISRSLANGSGPTVDGMTLTSGFQLLLRREHMQAWVSCTQRRQIQTCHYARRYNVSIQASLREFLDANAIRYLPVLFEDLIVNPEREVARLASFLGADVAVDHLRSTYDGVLYRRPKSLKDTAEATLIYLKNYRERLR